MLTTTKPSQRGVLITAPPGALDEGLFGRLILWLLEILPYLHRNGIYPAWRLPSALYGVGPDHLALPGVLDLAYDPPASIARTVSLIALRNRWTSHLGPDWANVNRLFTSYFALPDRVRQAADRVPVDAKTIGLHYRGTDKIASEWDSNPFTRNDFVEIALEFLRDRPDAKKVFLATDDPEIHDLLRLRTDLEIIHCGTGAFHQDQRGKSRTDYNVADAALRDCLLLSRCGSVLLTSSALSAFAKVLNPDLEIFRCAASKPMWYGPYFPVAYVEKFESRSETISRILEKTMRGDWTDHTRSRRFSGVFISKPNWRWRLGALSEKVKAFVRR